tara:strand:+ start:461 stop:781 length:321 start_codon:yes stop_codon:yes gene_type:complete
MLEELNKLCRPAYFYFVSSVFIVTFLFIQNLGNTNLYCVGSYQCQVPNTTVIFVGKLLYILFWTWLLNLICKSGFSEISWLLVLFPIILFFVLLGVLILESPRVPI